MVRKIWCIYGVEIEKMNSMQDMLFFTLLAVMWVSC